MILALDTSGPNVALALGNAAGELRASLCKAQFSHNEILDSELSALLDSDGEDVDLIAVTTGPGSFTGTRVGVSYAIGLAQALAGTILPVSSYRLAAELASTSEAEIHVAFSVVREAWCCCRLTRVGDDWLESDEREVNVAELDALTARGQVVIPWGDPRSGLPPAANWNPAASLHALACRASKGSYLQPHVIHVRYLGPSQAERNFHARPG
jgi:tRNA threonylcarbamoyl adenosine modification protein YeaZ